VLFFPVMDILLVVIQFAVVLFAISIHEASHAWMADRFGDPTAKLQGRITLNPIAHIDPIGTIIFPLLLAIMGAPVFGWAKPVMVNPLNLRDRRRANVFISAAGPVSNIVCSSLGIVIFLILKRVNVIGFGELSRLLYHLQGLEGTRPGILTLVLFYLILINIFLAIFNLIPIPPLDGSGIIEGVLKGEALYQYQKIKPYGFIILIIIIYVGALDIIARPIFSIVLNIIFRG
jgi:Zn-dependent protease